MISPCINLCAIDRARGTCAGCGRTLAEIAAWPSMSDGERAAVMARLAGRTDAPASDPEAS